MVAIMVVGCGRVGSIHARSVARSPVARLVGVADPNAEAAGNLAQALDTDVLDPETCLEEVPADGVVIASATPTHVPLMLRASAAGKAVFCEKPIDLDLARVDDCLARLRQAGTPLMLGFNRRFDHSFAALKAKLDARAVGPVELIQITSRDPGPPPIDYIRVSGGLFRDMTIHDLDMARWLLGTEPVSVQATGSCRVDSQIGESGDVDTAAVVLRGPKGEIATVTNSRRAAYGYDQRVEVLGPNGMVQLGNRLTDQVVTADSDGLHSARPEHFFLQRYAEAFARETTEFAENLAEARPMVPNGWDGRQALALADAATKAAQTGTAVAPP